ncbi:MAG: class I SAM-dependent methyltransferase [Treponema sp.]|nr:class I SAM-dependent methyltransferase [Treponema sp.]
MTRCLRLVNDLRALGREATLFLPAASQGAAYARELLDERWIAASKADIEGNSWSLVVLDLFRTSREEYDLWASVAPVVGIDEGGDHRGHFDFLVDILPNLCKSEPNVAGPSLLPLPKDFIPKKTSVVNAPKILITFGQEDKAGLGAAIASALSLALEGVGNEGPTASILIGNLGKSGAGQWRGIEALEALPNLSARIGEYDLAITHFGLTAFEALYAGVSVALLSPTRLHERLAKKAGFYSLGAGTAKAKKLAKKLIKNGRANAAFLESLARRCRALAVRHGIDRKPELSLAQLLSGFSPSPMRDCAICGAPLSAPPLARFDERAYKRCAQCGAISMARTAPPALQYSREYFFELYQKQYGKTYIEDFPNLIAMAKKRIARIKALLPARLVGAAILDIGCAYGPFLAAARDEGFSPQGIDPSPDAVSYVRQSLGLPACQGFFTPGLFDECQFDAITLWYVIEHFEDCRSALAEIRRVLKPGGVLAFSTPSFSGISGRRSLREFLRRSPEDHWTLWSPGSCKKALALAGFRVERIVVTGHHPERFPLIRRFARGEKNILHKMLFALSRAFSLGDTFEVYARRL